MATRGHGEYRKQLIGARDGGNIWWIAPSYPIASDIWRDLKRSCRGAWTDKSEIERRIEFPSRGSVSVKSADNPDSLRGSGLDGVILDEAATIKVEAWQQSIRPALADKQGWATFIGTPKGFNWFYELFREAEGREGWERWQRPSKENPLLTEKELADARLEIGGIAYAQEFEASFVNMEGAEWPAEYFGDHIWFDDWPNCPWLTKVMSLDPSKGKADKSGDFNAFVILAVDRELNLWADCDMSQTRPIEPLNAGDQSVITDGIEIARVWQPDGYVIETNGFQEMVATAQLRIARDKGVHLPLHTINNTQPKVTRIRTLGSYFAQRRIRIRNTVGGRLLVQQLREFPCPDCHDDGPDALKTAEMMANHLINGQREGSGQIQVLRA